MQTFESRCQQGCVELIPGAANGTAACGVPGSGLGDAKRAACFFQPFGARDSCHSALEALMMRCIVTYRSKAA